MNWYGGQASSGIIGFYKDTILVINIGIDKDSKVFVEIG